MILVNLQIPLAFCNLMQSSFQIRGANKGPIAFNTSFVTSEDQVKVIALEGSDMDDMLAPIFYVTRSPTNGYLYQCVTFPGGGCGLGQKLARQNESVIDWATVDVDPEGALDGVNRQVEIPSIPIANIVHFLVFLPRDPTALHWWKG